MKKILLVAVPTLLIGCTQPSPQEHLNKAQQYAANKETAAAVIELKNAIQQNPEYAEARFLLGKLYMEQKDYPSAEKEFSRVLELGYKTEEALPLLTEALSYSGSDVAIANLDFSKYSVPSQEAVKLDYLQLKSLLRLDKVDEAQTLFEKIAAYNVDSIYKSLAQAYQLAMDQKLEDALVLVDNALTTAPGNEYALQQQAILLIQLDRKEEAIAAYQKLLDYNPDNLEVKFVLTKMLVEANKLDRAEKLVDELLTVNNEHGLLNYYKSYILFSQKSFDEAMSHIEKALHTNTSSTLYHLLAGYINYAQKDFKNAQEHFSLIASNLPNGHPALKLMAATELKAGNVAAASDALTRISNPSDGDLELFALTSFELIKDGHLEKAKELISQSESVAGNPSDLERLGILKLSVNDLAGIDTLEEAIEKDPTLQTAKLTLATAYLKTQQYDKAMSLAQDWRAMDANDSRPLLIESLVAKAQNDFNQALAKLDEARKIDQANPAINVLQAEISEQQGNTDAALATLTSTMDAYPTYFPAISRFIGIKMKTGELTDAIQTVSKIQKANPDNQYLRLLTATTLTMNQQFKEVISLLEADKSENKPELLQRLLGNAYMKNGNIQKAGELYEQWYLQQPDNEFAMSGKLTIMQMKGNFSDALDLLNHYAAQVGESQYTHLMRSALSFRTNKIDRALAELALLSEKNLNTPVGHSLQAQAAFVNKDFEKALNEGKIAYQTQPDPLHTRIIMASLERLGKADESEQFLQNHLKQFPNDQSALLLSAERSIANSTDEAITKYENIVKANPKNAVALNNLAYLYKEQKQLDKALGLAEKAVELVPNSPEILDTYGEILLLKGNAKQAVEVLEKSASSPSASETVKLHYLQALVSNGQTDMAKRKIKQYQFVTPAIVEQIKALEQKL
ncbi:XrtA/PEP-CTERM system TPR-repeat protein PrsT [Bowmanella sp. JS7-9]|uniref:XrtA/PEP-CTERM system TPR-repeat protein PrsT n=2 Tax=Pseudobowmanella zhangzhouensis TaxID=1537679 RepID=A0ABW1XID7_9ALTE|nr:XrtA/PEP-CTERM system TPR-repeat protein PrsT [Bowmanella sp. JS7-9]TBX21245.1 hypothetical protein TK45_11755 [Bowmanella sp. JS7-9]